MTPEPATTTTTPPLTGRAWWVGCLLVALGALAATVPSLGDLGLTYDEPAYRYSQEVSAQWWLRLAEGDFQAIVEPDALLYYWPYARHGINFHPPLSGQLNLLTYAIFGGVMKDIPARRLATALEYVLTITLLFGFLARRYNVWVGGVAAAALLLMPRVYGQAMLVETDTLGMLLWLATALAFWKGLNEPGGRPWRVLVGVLLGLAFVQKMGAVFVVIPLVAWLLLTRLPGSFRRGGKADWVDGITVNLVLLAPLILAFLEVRRLADVLPPPQRTDLFRDRPPTDIPGAILLSPMFAWLIRELVRRVRRGHRTWGVERPALETWAAILAFAPVVAWLGNPAWWRETLPRLAHYYTITIARRGSLPDIQTIYFGQIYQYSLPWHSGWMMLAITVPVTLLSVAMIGAVIAIIRAQRDLLPMFFLVLAATLPTLRVLPTPAHDGVRLFLPTFAFLAGLAGWGAWWASVAVVWLIRPARRAWLRALVAATVLLPAAWALARVHPFELSYYNALIGGPRGAWEAGFELSYWYDAYTPEVLADLNERLPEGAAISYANEQSNPVMVIQDLLALDQLRGDLRLWDPFGRDEFPFMLLLTHDSKASAFTRLLFALEPWYAVRPPQLDGLRVASVYDPATVARAWALQLMTDFGSDRPPDPPAAPAWVRENVPMLARLWGDGLETIPALNVNAAMLAWAEDDPEGLRQAARWIADGKPLREHPGAARMAAVLSRYDDRASGRDFSGLLLRTRPEAVFEAALILIARGDAVERVLLHQSYRDPAVVGGYLDQDIPHE